MRLLTSLLCVGSLVVTGCSGGARTDDSSSTSSGALTSDVRATNCEIFVDRAIPVSGSHALTEITVYLKTFNDRLDAPIDHVGFYRKRTEARCVSSPSSCDSNNDSGKWKEERLNAFVGSADYFELTLFIGGDYSPENTFEGAFFVQTTKGTKYWANTQEGGNFVLSRQTFNDLSGNHYPAYRSDPQNAVVTADGFPYLNPGKCR